MEASQPRILVLGASGLLGSRVFSELSKIYRVQGTMFNNSVKNDRIVKLNAFDPNSLNKIIELNPNVIINCVGLTNVEQCETQRNSAWYLNAEFPTTLAKISKQLNAKLIHISTDHFSFKSLSDRSEKAPVKAVNFYGESKLAGESSVLLNDTSALIIRTNFFGKKSFIHSKESFFETLIKNVRNKQQTNGFTDIYFTPISISELVKAITILFPSKYSGIINICGNQRITKFEFCIELVKVMKSDPDLIQKARIESQPNLVKRPSDMSMSNLLYCKETGQRIPNFQEMLKQEYSSQNETVTE